jgi:hypothetical protein
LVGTSFLDPLLNSLEDNDKLDLIASVDSNKEPIFIPKLLSSTKLTAEQKIAILSSKGGRFPFYEKTIFTYYFSPVKKIVPTILNTKALSSDQKTNLLNLLDKKGNNFLTDYDAHTDLVQILETDELSSEQKMRLLSQQNYKGQTFLHVDSNNINKIRALLNTSKLSSEEKIILLNITDYQQERDTWLNKMVRYGRRTPQPEICLQEILMTKQLSVAQKMELLCTAKILLEIAYEEEGAFMLSLLQLLDTAGFSVEHKMTLLMDITRDGQTPLLRSCRMGYLKIAAAILNSVPEAFRARLLNYINPETGKRVNIIDEVHNDPESVAFLKQYGACFGERVAELHKLREEARQELAARKAAKPGPGS